MDIRRSIGGAAGPVETPPLVGPWTAPSVPSGASGGPRTVEAAEVTEVTEAAEVRQYPVADFDRD
ncbi:hypothetical protein ACFZDG_21705 [Kitasatospora xanthocidica]|uniref:hypothetical protein n=1 Tax=Kitasatospora xanthocidica TaxID=83382 RepID=UPI0036EABBFE